MSPDPKLALYRSLAQVEVVRTEGGEHVLASIHPARPRTGMLGGLEGGPAAIAAGEAWLRARGCTEVHGPMEVSTWFRYRARLSGTTPPFWGEPTSSPLPWLHAGYTLAAKYRSDRVLAQDALRTAAAKHADGVELRRMRGVEETLRTIHAISHAAFTQAFLFTPLPYAAFAAIYAPLLPQLDPHLVLIAEKEGTPIGFMFGAPDFQGGVRERFIIKSTAVLPEHQGSGLCTVMMGALYRAALARGFSEGVHALMWSGSGSGFVCPGNTVAEYGLYRKTLG